MDGNGIDPPLASCFPALERGKMEDLLISRVFGVGFIRMVGKVVLDKSRSGWFRKQFSCAGYSTHYSFCRNAVFLILRIQSAFKKFVYIIIFCTKYTIAAYARTLMGTAVQTQVAREQRLPFAKCILSRISFQKRVCQKDIFYKYNKNDKCTKNCPSHNQVVWRVFF